MREIPVEPGTKLFEYSPFTNSDKEEDDVTLLIIPNNFTEYGQKLAELMVEKNNHTTFVIETEPVNFDKFDWHRAGNGIGVALGQIEELNKLIKRVITYQDGIAPLLAFFTLYRDGFLAHVPGLALIEPIWPLENKGDGPFEEFDVNSFRRNLAAAGLPVAMIIVPKGQNSDLGTRVNIPIYHTENVLHEEIVSYVVDKLFI
jgi:hypothetical protein